MTRTLARVPQTLDEIKAKHPDAEVIYLTTGEVVATAVEYVDALDDPFTDIPEAGILIVEPSYEAYFVPADALGEAAVLGPEPLEFLEKEGYLECETGFKAMPEGEALEEFNTEINELGYADAVDALDADVIDYLETPYGTAWDASDYYRLSVIYPSIKSQIITYQLA